MLETTISVSVPVVTVVAVVRSALPVVTVAALSLPVGLDAPLEVESQLVADV